MSWIRHVVLDVIIVFVIALATIFDIGAARWVVIVYTPLMILLKGIALLGGSLVGQFRGKEEPPEWFFHVVYGLSVILLVAGSWWIMAAGWLLIWALSVVAGRKTPLASRKKKATS